MHFSGEPDLQGQRLKYLSAKRGKGYALYIIRYIIHIVYIYMCIVYIYTIYTPYI